MAVELRSVGVSPGANSTSCVVVKPVGLTVGGLMIAHIYFREHGSDDGQIGSPANWTLIRQDSYDGATFTSALFWKIADAGDVAASNFTFTGETGSNIGAISAWETGTFDADTPINANNGQANGSGYTVTAPTITPSVANCMILMLVGASNNLSSSGYAIATSDPGGWAEAYDIKTTEGSDSAVALGYVERPETSATGNGTASTSPTYSYPIGQLVAISPLSSSNYRIADKSASMGAKMIGHKMI